MIIAPVFGGFVKEGFERFPNEPDNARMYSLVLSYLHLRHEVTGSKRQLLNSYIYHSLLTEKPVRLYVPICLRHYYDAGGERKMIGDLNDFEYMNLSGNQVIKSASQFLGELDDELLIAKSLGLIGVNIEVVASIMDHELLTLPGGGADIDINEFVIGVSEYLAQAGSDCNFRVNCVSALEYFGNPQLSTDYRSITAMIRENERSYLGITNQQFEYAVNKQYEKNNVDENRGIYYRSSEYARKYLMESIASDYVQSRIMVERAVSEDTAGVVCIVPLFADIEQKVMNLNKELVTISNKENK